VCVCVCVGKALGHKLQISGLASWRRDAELLHMRCYSSFVAATHLSLAHALSQEAQDGGASMHGGASTPRMPEAYAKVFKVLVPPFPAKQLGQSS
jgi:hypothetical protein